MAEEKPLKTAVIIVAAGQGRRFGGPVPKQWLSLGGVTLAAHAVARFRAALPDALIALVVAEADRERAAEIDGVRVVTGGDQRADSVRAGLEALSEDAIDRVLIHDAARPFVPPEVIHAVCEALNVAEGAAPGLPLTDALWKAKGGQVAEAPDREGLWRAQTPQGFRYSAILAAHRAQDAPSADDVAVARAAGIGVTIVPGDERNMKLTHPEDFERAAALLEEPMDIRTGTGFDVHRLGPGDHVWLCGVKIEHSAALVGHSDADVGLHAACDAIYGALAEGDIGRHFPPSDPRWKAADSAQFLTHAGKLAAKRGYRISNLDVTLVCEAPKIVPHAAAMCKRMAAILGIEGPRISVKATTSEGLGFTGREEGIAALASVTLVKP